MKYKEGITITNAFQKISDESNRKPNKTWIDKDIEKIPYKSIQYIMKENLSLKFINIQINIKKNICINTLDDIANKYKIHIIVQSKWSLFM